MNLTDPDRLLAEARATALQPGADLMARILADALAEQRRPAVAPARRAPAPTARRGFWAGLAEAFGGRGVLAGLGGAATFGLVLGYVDPASLGWLTGGLGGASVSECSCCPAPISSCPKDEP